MTCNDSLHYHLVQAAKDEFGLIDSEEVVSKKLDHVNKAMEYLNLAKHEIEKQSGKPFTGLNDLYVQYSNKFEEIVKIALDKVK